MAEARAQIDIVAADRTGQAFASVDRKLGGLTTSISKIGGLLGGLGIGLGVVQFTQLIGKSIQAGDELAKFASKAGIGAKAASELAYAGKLADVELGSMAAAFKKMQVALSEAGTGSKTANATLTALGLTLSEIRSLSADKQFELIADRISQLKDPADKTRAAVELFGRAGADLLPMFEQGAEGIRKARLEAEAMGKSFDAEQLQRFQDADDAMKRLNASFTGLFDTLIVKSGPAITGLLDFTRAMLGGQTEAERLRLELDDLNKMMERMGGAPTGPNGELLGINAQVAGRRRIVEARLAEMGQYAGAGGPSTRRGGAAAQAEVPGFLPPSADPKGKAAKAPIDTWARDMAAIADSIAKSGLKVFESVETSAERVMRQFEDSKRALEDFGRAFPEQGARVDEAMARLVAATQEELDTLSRMPEVAEDATDEMSVFFDEAFRSMQSSFADFLFDPFADGLKGMLKGFINVLRRMAAEAAAAQIFKYLGSSMSGSSSSWIAAIGSMFAGKAVGGPVSAGTPYMVGEKGMELFVPRQPGTIVPNHAIEAAARPQVNFTYAPNIKIDAGADASRWRQFAAQIKADAVADVAQLINGGAFA